MKILLTGADGQVGYELQRALACLGTVHATTRASLDLAQPATLRALLREFRPQLVVNAAAYTAVDLAEREDALAFAINAEAPAVMAEETARLGAALVHYSTDYVFDGSKHGAYLETDPTAPLGVYGRSKRAGEEAIAASGGRSLILRTSWVYASRGRNFPLTMLRLGRERPQLRVVADQRGAPTPARLLAELTGLLLAKLAQAGTDAWPRGEIFHASCAGSTTWHGFASAVVAQDAALHGRAAPVVEPIATADYPTAAARPANSVLSNEKLRERYGLALPEWTQAFALCFDAAQVPPVSG